MNLFTINLKKVVASALLIGGVAMSAQAQLELSGEFRTRTEFDHGHGAPGVAGAKSGDPGIKTGMRSRLHTSYKVDKLHFFVSLQDVRKFGDLSTADATGIETGLFQAWAKYSLGENSSLKIGKQVIAYDDQRIIGGLNWADQGRTFDAFTYEYKKGGTTLTVPVAHGTVAEGTSASADAPGYKFAFLPRLNQKFEGGDVSVLFLPLVKDGGFTTYTTGFAGKVAVSEGLKLGGNLYYVGGDVSSASKMSAVDASLYATTTSIPSTKLTVGAEYKSGDSDLTDDKNTKFSSPFGTNHKFNGFLDYFNGGMNAGLVDIFAKSKIKTGEKTAFVANVHYFMTAESIEDVYGVDESSTLGAEIDLVYVANLGSSTNLKVGYSQFVGGGSSTDLVKGLSDGVSADAFSGWGWVQLTFKPKFL